MVGDSCSPPPIIAANPEFLSRGWKDQHVARLGQLRNEKVDQDDGDEDQDDGDDDDDDGDDDFCENNSWDQQGLVTRLLAKRNKKRINLEELLAGLSTADLDIIVIIMIPWGLD